MDLKSLTDELRKFLNAIQTGNVNAWLIVEVMVTIGRFVLQFRDNPTDGDGRITFGASPVDEVNFLATLGELHAALGTNQSAVENMAGIGGRIAERALAELVAALEAWIKSQGFSSIIDAILAILGNLPTGDAPPVTGAAPEA